MNLNVTSLLSHLTLEHDDKLSTQLSAAATESKKSGDPLAVRFKPGVREYVTLASAKMGISASEFINILIEGVIRETLSPFQNRATQVVERFQLLMGAHNLKITDVAMLLSPWNIGLSVLESRERTMDYLTDSLLSEMARWFNINKCWLTAESSSSVAIPGNIPDWHNPALRISNILADISLTELPQIVLIRDTLAPSVDKYSDETLVGVSLITVKLKNGVPFRIAEYLGEQIPYGGHKQLFNDFMAYCGVLEKKGLANIITCTTDTSTLRVLLSGKVLPIMILNKILNQHHLNPWNKEEVNLMHFPDKHVSQDMVKKINNTIYLLK
jgi:antitoxin component of RelBE/YafQ-DinJ toxin-antitoxin module